MAGIYLHIPFCSQACYYCDFHFSTNQEKKHEVVMAIAKELDLQKNYLEGEPVKTIYFGGGTPSLLSEDELKTIFEVLHRNFTIASACEVTLEANPDDLSPAKLKTLRNTGVNRLSIGIQSFDDQVLQFLNRAHNAHAALHCIEQAREAAFNNISIDLIYAIPGQKDEAWKKNIEQALQLNPEHISSYSLTIEEKTTFGRWTAKGKLNPVEDETAATQLELLVDTLAGAGFEQYEVSNFSKPGFLSQHNSSYWKQEKYLGVGPSAHSYNGVSRQYNISNNHIYLKSLTDDKIPFTLEVLTREDKINDYLLTTLRTAWGARLEKLQQEYDYDLLKLYPGYINGLVEKKLAILQNNILILTRAGKLLADKIASDLFLVKAESLPHKKHKD